VNPQSNLLDSHKPETARQHAKGRILLDMACGLKYIYPSRPLKLASWSILWVAHLARSQSSRIGIREDLNEIVGHLAVCYAVCGAAGMRLGLWSIGFGFDHW